ncbi:hypothetical protein HK096_002826 [Nowakowskiella sp. JEL0078]|nr:hypothetical protein HK096_002826 [Nowakowskiella sp. JEL0078]
MSVGIYENYSAKDSTREKEAFQFLSQIKLDSSISAQPLTTQSIRFAEPYNNSSKLPYDRRLSTASSLSLDSSKNRPQKHSVQSLSAYIPETPRQQLVFNFLSTIPLQSNANSIREVIPPDSSARKTSITETFDTSDNDSDSSLEIETRKKTVRRGSNNSKIEHIYPNHHMLERRGSELSFSSVAERLFGSRIVYVFGNGDATTTQESILSIFSVIPHDGDTRVVRKLTRRRSLVSNTKTRVGASEVVVSPIKDPKRKKLVSFAHLLEPSGNLLSTSLSNYNPNQLDDPLLKTGRNRTVITLPSYMCSIIHYSRPGDLKNELNEHFRDHNPGLGAGMTLSKIRSVKIQLGKISDATGMEMSSLACAFVYFEKLVLKGYVNKSNRKLVASVCLLLASKVNETKEFDFKILLEAIDKVFDITEKHVLGLELAVYTELEFQLFLPLVEIIPHLDRIVANGERTIDEYSSGGFWFLGQS